MKKIFKIFAAALTGALLLASCSDVDSGSDSSSSSSSSEKAYLKIVDSCVSERTAIPEGFTIADFDYFNIYGIRDTAFVGSWEEALASTAADPLAVTAEELEACRLNERALGSDELSNLIELPKGSYWFMLEAGNNRNVDELKFKGTLHTELEAGENVVSFDLYPEKYGTTGKGTVDLTVSFPAVVKRVTLKISDLNTTTGAWITPTSTSVEWTASNTRNPITNNSISYLDERASAGVYVYEFDFYNKETTNNSTPAPSTLKTYRELVIVADGKTSKASITIDSLKVQVADRVKDTADTIGDIVLSNGKAIAYDPSITKAELASYLTSASLTAVGVVYYAGYVDSRNPTANEEVLEDRLLCVAVDGTTVQSSIAGATGSTSTVYTMTTAPWALITDSGYETNLQKIAVADHTSSSTIDDRGGGSYTSSYGTIFSGWYTDVEKKNWVEPLFDGTTAITLLKNAPTDNPAGHNYQDINGGFRSTAFPAFGTISTNPVGAGTGTLANSKYYLPSVIELLELCAKKDTVNKSLALVVANEWDVLGGTEATYHKERYWSSSQSARENTLAWSVGFYGENNVGVPMASDKTESHSVVAIFEYNK